MADGPTSQDSNHRVTLAEIKRDLAHLIAEFQEMRDEARTWRKVSEERQRLLELQCQENRTSIARLDERQKATTGILGTATFIGSAIAAAIGSLVK